MIAAVATYAPRLLDRWMPGVLSRIPTSERRVHLTFDDGPSAEHAFAILECLDRYDAKSTFFLLGRHARSRPDLVREIVGRGHGVGGHTETHPDPWRHSARYVLGEFETGCEAIESITGSRVGLIRPPYGRLRPCIAAWARATGRRVVMWDVMPADYRPRADPERMTRFVMRKLRRGSIVVLHDNPQCAAATPRMLELLLPRLRDSGWVCSAVD